jgi:phenylalanyl-tRNA synthetase beta chain
MQVEPVDGGWKIEPPSWRYDVEREEDLIEEVARLVGYGQIPETPGDLATVIGMATERSVDTARLRSVLVDRGYREAITYSFVDFASDQALAETDGPGLALSNPISADLSVMRRSLWPGLLRAARHNLDRQQKRLRLFEIGARFLPQGTGHREETLLSGIACGARWPEQWGGASGPVDLFDVKGHLEALFALTGAADQFLFEEGAHRGLHPARTARIRRLDSELGWIGELHPRVARDLGLPDGIILFELCMDCLRQATVTRVRPISRFPSVRRDLAVVVAADVPVAAMRDAVRSAAPARLRDVVVFDIYTGGQIGSGQKSVAIGLILQDTYRTLTEAEVDAETARIAAALKEKFGAAIRDQ